MQAWKEVYQLVIFSQKPLVANIKTHQSWNKRKTRVLPQQHWPWKQNPCQTWPIATNSTRPREENRRATRLPREDMCYCSVVPWWSWWCQGWTKKKDQSSPSQRHSPITHWWVGSDEKQPHQEGLERSEPVRKILILIFFALCYTLAGCLPGAAHCVWSCKLLMVV